MEKTNSELIDVFMGIDPETEYDVINYANDHHNREWLSKYSYDDVKHSPTTSLEGTRIKQKPYDKDWNLLMPVVEKIMSLENSRFNVEISCHGVDVWDHIAYTEVKTIEIHKDYSPLIQVVYEAVVDFIKWHQNQLK